MQSVSQRPSPTPGVGLRAPPRHALKAAPQSLRNHAPKSRVTRPQAISYSDDDIFGNSHRLGRPEPTIPARDLSAEDKAACVEREKQRILQQTQQRSEKLKHQHHLEHLNHELKFGKLMMAQGSVDSALLHFEKVIAGSSPDSFHRGEATLQKAQCLERQGKEAEAHALYQSLIQFRAPFPDIKRRAAQALFGSPKEGGSAKGAAYDDYMYRMFLSGFGSYMPKEKYVQSKEEKQLLNLVPWAILLMAPTLLVGLLFFPRA